MTEHHLVSRGYQNNFATQPTKTVVLLDAATGRVLDQQMPTLRNWALPDFNSFVTEDGSIVEELEKQWARIEGKVLDQIRRVNLANFSPELEAAVMNLIAIHLFRSEPFLDAHRRIMGEVLDDVPTTLEQNPRAIEAFERDFARKPEPGEIAGLARQLGELGETTNQSFVASMARMHNRIGELVEGWRVQIVETDPSLPGFVLPDVPVVHYNSARRAFGFRDTLALRDADVIGAPLTRHTAVFLTASRPRHKRLATKKLVQLVNALFWRSAIREVACHPDDELEARRVFQHLRDLPPEALLDTPSTKLGAH